MVDISVQVKEILAIFHQEQNRAELCKYFAGLSYRIEHTSVGDTVSPYNENRLSFIQEHFQVELEKINQKYTSKKLRRMISKVQAGKYVYIRNYGSSPESIDDFQYVRIRSVNRSWYGSRVIRLENGESIRLGKLKRNAQKLFWKFHDWVIYEDINISDAEEETADDLELLYIEQLYRSSLCISNRKYIVQNEGNRELIVGEEFLIQRKKIYEIWKTCRGYRDDFDRYIERCLELYEKRRMTREEFQKCLKEECRLLELLEIGEVQQSEGKDEESDCNRFRNFRNDLCMRACE